MRVLAAIVRGATPEEVADYLELGFPSDVEQLCEQELQQQELGDHVDLLAYALQRRQLPAAAA